VFIIYFYLDLYVERCAVPQVGLPHHAVFNAESLSLNWTVSVFNRSHMYLLFQLLSWPYDISCKYYRQLTFLCPCMLIDSRVGDLGWIDRCIFMPIFIDYVFKLCSHAIRDRFWNLINKVLSFT